MLSGRITLTRASRPSVDFVWIEMEVQQYCGTLNQRSKEDVCSKKVALPDQFAD